MFPKECIKDAGLGISGLKHQDAAPCGIRCRQVVNDAPQVREEFEVSGIDTPTRSP